MNRPVLMTPLYHWHQAKRVRFIEIDSWQVPAVYSRVEEEVAAARTASALADVSALAKVGVTGREVSALTYGLVGDSKAAKPLGVSKIDAGGPVLACRLRGDHLLLLASATDLAELKTSVEHISKRESVILSDENSAYAEFCLVGLHTEEVLRRVTAFDVSATGLPAGSCAETGLAGVHALLVRAPQPALLSTRVLVSWDVAEHVWERLLRAGQDRGIVPLGWEGLRVLGWGAV